jgi:K+-transporting ATPase A subunit
MLIQHFVYGIYLCVSCDSQNKQILFSQIALANLSLGLEGTVFFVKNLNFRSYFDEFTASKFVWCFVLCVAILRSVRDERTL